MTATLWMDIERTFLVIERVDRGSPSGVREVSFVLATSELAQIEVPDLDDPDDTDRELDPDLYTDDPSPPEFGPETQPIIKLDPWSTVFAGFDLPGGGGSGGGSGNLPWDGGSLFPNCCETPPISVTEVGEPTEDTGEVVAWTAGIVVFGGRIWDEFAEFLETDGLSREVREEDGSYFSDWVYVVSPWTRPGLGIITTVSEGVPTPSSAGTIWTLRHSEAKAGFTVSVFTAPLPASFGYTAITLSPAPGAFGTYRFDMAYDATDVVQVVAESSPGSEVNALSAELAPLASSSNIVYSVLFRVNMAYLGSHPAAWANGLKPTGGASGMVTQNSNAVIPLQVMTLDSAFGVGDSRRDVDWEWEGESADALTIMLELEL